MGLRPSRPSNVMLLNHQFRGLNIRPLWTTCSDTILNQQFIQKVKLVVEGKFNYISPTDVLSSNWVIKVIFDVFDVILCASVVVLSIIN